MIKIKNISKKYGDLQVLKDVSLEFSHGITCISGVSGIGKTTLCRIIAGLEQADSGEIFFSNETSQSENTCIKAKNITENVPRFSYVFQEDRLLSQLNVIKNLLFVTNKKAKNTSAHDIAVDLLTKIGLSDSADKPVSELSGGMKRRAAVCRALMIDADVYIFDEPFKGLDEKTKKLAMDLVKSQTRGKIVIVITHDETETEYLSATKTVNLSFT